MENKDDNVLFNLSEMRIISELLCSECQRNINDLLKLWRTKQNENSQRLQPMAEGRTNKDIETKIENEIERRIEKSDD